MNVTFRVDASLIMGSGHMIRCLTLAMHLRELGADCWFVCGDNPGNMAGRIRELGFELNLLKAHAHANQRMSDEPNSEPPHANWLSVDWRSDANQTISAIGGRRVDWLIVDHYGIDHKWESLLRRHCDRLMVIDDLADRQHDCDLLLDQNYFANSESRYEGRISPAVTCLLGPRYAVLQNEYSKAHQKARFRCGPISRVLVYFGAADNKNVTQRAIAALVDEVEESTQIDVVVDPQNQFLREISALLSESRNAELFIGAPSLCPLMLKADLALGAAGTTSWERCAVGLPALVISIADNQREVAKELHAGGFIKWLGHEDQVSIGSIQESIRHLRGGENLERWSRHCWSLVDGAGLERVGFYLSATPQTEFLARSIKQSDEALILRWANDPVVRRNAFCTRTISEVEHREWFHTILKSPHDNRFYIVEGPSEVPVGQVRFDRLKVGWEVTYSIDQVFRSRGLGSHVLETAIARFKLEQDGAPIIGKVRKSNTASMKVFERLGFRKIDNADYFVTFSLN